MYNTFHIKNCFLHQTHVILLYIITIMLDIIIKISMYLLFIIVNTLLINNVIMLKNV